MKANLGSLDRFVRLFTASILVAYFVWNMSYNTAGFIVLFIALILVVTATVSFCPIYKALGIKSLRSKRKIEVN